MIIQTTIAELDKLREKVILDVLPHASGVPMKSNEIMYYANKRLPPYAQINSTTEMKKYTNRLLNSQKICIDKDRRKRRYFKS